MTPKFSTQRVTDARRASAFVDEDTVPPLFTPSGQKPIAPRQISVHYTIPSVDKQIHVEVMGKHVDMGTKRNTGIRRERVNRRIDPDQLPYTDQWIQDYVERWRPSDAIGELRRMIESLRAMRTPASDGESWNDALEAAVSIAEIRIEALGGEVA